VARKRKGTEPFADLTWVDLNRWAGGKIVGRGRGYQRDGAVEALAGTSGGGLIAWVDGTRRYATLVERDAGGGLLSTCTCPYEGACKHAVAVVLEYWSAWNREPRSIKTDQWERKATAKKIRGHLTPALALGVETRVNTETDWQIC